MIGIEQRPELAAYVGAPALKKPQARAYAANLAAWVRGQDENPRSKAGVVVAAASHEAGHAICSAARGFKPQAITIDLATAHGMTKPHARDEIATGSEWKKLPDDLLPLMLAMASGYAGELALTGSGSTQCCAHELGPLVYLCQYLQARLSIPAARVYAGTISTAHAMIERERAVALAVRERLIASGRIEGDELAAMLSPVLPIDCLELWQREMAKPTHGGFRNLAAEAQTFGMHAAEAMAFPIPESAPTHVVQTLRAMAGYRDVLQSGHAALAFSGGKDSVACLLLLRPVLPFIHVIWANTGKNYPEMVRTMELAKSLCPNFIEVQTDRDAQWKVNGLPADLVPIDWTNDGQKFTCAKPIKVQSYLQCCMENISLPVWRKAQQLGVSLIIRGQRDDESRKGPGRDGMLVDGMRIWHPIEKWTAAQVYEYLRAEIGELPAHAYLEHSSMDCYDCTAFSKNSLDRAAYTRAHHPALYREYAEKMLALSGPMREQMNQFEVVLGTLQQGNRGDGNDITR